MAGIKELVKSKKSKELSPFTDFERWFEDMWLRPSPLFSRMWPVSRCGEAEEISPSLDIYEEDNELVLKADMPGVDKNDIKVELTDHMLTISGEKEKEEKIEKENYYRCERVHGSFYRRLELPEEVDTEHIKAHFENGVLEVKIPKPKEEIGKIKEISIE
jgi:HSP20 family protein